MKTLRALALVLSLLVPGALAQQNANGNPSGEPGVGVFSTVELPLLTSLPPVRNANIAIVGNPGNGTYFYWLVTNYTFGQAPVQGPFIAIQAPTVLSSTNYVTITPNYLPGATVDVLRTTSFTPPSGTGNYAVSTGNTSGAISDQGGALSSYTLNPANPASQTNCLSTQVAGAGEGHLYLTQGPDCQTFIADLTAIGTSTGTVTNLTIGNLSPLFTATVINATTTPAISFALDNAPAYSVLGNTNGTTGVPGYTNSPTLNNLTLNTALTLGFLTSAGTECLHSVSGVVLGTGSDCGSGSSGITGSGTIGYLPIFTAAAVVADSPVRVETGVLQSSDQLQIINQGGTLPTGVQALLAGSTYTGSSACGLFGGTNTWLSQPDCDAAIIENIPNGAAAGVVAGLFAQAQAQALSSTPAVTAVYGWAATNGNGSPNYITGVVGAGNATAGWTGTIANLTGVEGLAFLQGSQTATIMAGVAGQVQNQAGGTTTPMGAALYARAPAFTSGAVITDIYGLYLEDMTAGGGTANPNPHGIYEAGAAPNVLNGSLTLLNLGGTTQCLQSIAGLIVGTGATCGGSGSPGSPSLSMQGNNAGAFFGIPGTAFSASNGITEFEISGPRPLIDVTAPEYGADSSGATDSAAAVQAALNECSGAAYTVFFPAGTYILDSIVTASHPCTMEGYPGTVVIQKHFNAGPSNNYTNPGYLLVTAAASPFVMRGLTFDCNAPTYSGACVVGQGAIQGLTFDGEGSGGIINCDGPCFLTEGTAVGGAAPNKVLVTHSTLISGPNSTTTGAGGTISAKDSSDGLQYVDNPLIDGHLDTYSGSGTLELECGHTGATLSNILISGNPKIIGTGNALTGGGWAIQAGAFGCLTMYGLKIENNGLEVAGSVNGIVSIPSTYGAIVKGNHFNTHFRDLQQGASDGVSQISPPLFTSASGAFVNTIPGSATGRTLAYLCSGTWYYTLVTYASSTTLTPATTPTCAGSSEQYDLLGYSPTFTALELGNSVGPVVSGNTFDVESAQWLAAIWGDNTSDADISGNDILGFGTGNIGTSAAATVGIGINAGYAQNGISTITQVAHIITVTTESALIGQTQSGMKIALCSPSNVCTPTGYYGFYQIDAVPVQLGTTFTLYSPSTGNSCSGGHATCGYVEYVGVNNKVHGNKIEFAKILPPATPLYGIQIKGASSTSVLAFNDVWGNTISGTGPGTNEYCGSVQAASGVVDSNILGDNTCSNMQFGFNRTAGTNTTWINPNFNNITTPWPGTAQTGEIREYIQGGTRTFTEPVDIGLSGGGVLTLGATGQSSTSTLTMYGCTTSSNLCPPYINLENEAGTVGAWLYPSTSFNGSFGIASSAPTTDVQAGGLLYAPGGVGPVYTTGSSGTTGLLQCPVSATSSEVQDCGSNATNFYGVAEATGNSNTRLKSYGVVTINIPSSTTNNGDFMCSGTLSAGTYNAVDNGSTPCPANQFIGYATVHNASAVTSVKVQLFATNGADTTATANSLTINNSGSGAASGATFNGAATLTISYNTIGAADAALSNLASVSINTSLLAQTGVDLGSTANPFRNLYLFGGGTYGTDSFELTGTSTANRTVTLPDNSGTVAELNLAQTWAAAQALGSSTATTQSACNNSTDLATTAYAGLTCSTVETSGSPLSATAQSQMLWNNSSGAYVVDLPAPTTSGPQICFGNYKAVAQVISFVPGSGVTIYYKGVAGTAGSSTGLVSGGAAGDFICVVGGDSTTYEAVGAGQGTWTNH